MKTRVNDEIFILMTDVRNSGMVGIDVRWWKKPEESLICSVIKPVFVTVYLMKKLFLKKKIKKDNFVYSFYFNTQKCPFFLLNFGLSFSF